MTTSSATVAAPTRRSPLGALVRYWPTSLLLLVLGLLAGLGLAATMPVEYRAATRLAIVPSSTSAYGIPGYPQGARELAADYARWVQNTVGVEGLPEGATEASATPVPETAVIVVEGRGTSREAARAAAAQTSGQLVSKVGEALALRDPEQAYRQFMTLQPQVAKAQADVERAQARVARAQGANASASTLAAAEKALTQARTAYAELDLRQNAQADLYRRLLGDTHGNSRLTEVAPVADVGSNRTALFARWGLIGLGLGYLAAQFLALARDRRGARRS